MVARVLAQGLPLKSDKRVSETRVYHHPSFRWVLPMAISPKPLINQG
jgi:hypothetical protein